ncbi:hypothetical protein [uncultured Cyclobacterium sp.]|uniref:hypothetical protein n=1 Tax=uncultured Cyclobacterium sp. TaxID=453820 RepID=UPI0030EDFC03|tara:strand:+ start:89494 stop:89700 length:207 start_codon:yes stop_codon:yes gene_type:complete
MDLLIGGLIIVAIVIAIILLYKRIFNTKRSKVGTEQEISAKEVLGKEVSEINDRNITHPKSDKIKKEE